MKAEDVRLVLTDLTINDVNAILAALPELPAKICNPLSYKIETQAKQQVEQLEKQEALAKETKPAE